MAARCHPRPSPEVDAFLARPNHAVGPSLSRDGSPHTAPTWYDWEQGRLLLSMHESRLRPRFMRRDPRVALTALDHKDWSRHVSLLGRIGSLEEDVDLRDVDRLALRYTGERFRLEGNDLRPLRGNPKRPRPPAGVGHLALAIPFELNSPGTSWKSPLSGSVSNPVWPPSSPRLMGTRKSTALNESVNQAARRVTTTSLMKLAPAAN